MKSMVKCYYLLTILISITQATYFEHNTISRLHTRGTSPPSLRPLKISSPASGSRSSRDSSPKPERSQSNGNSPPTTGRSPSSRNASSVPARSQSPDSTTNRPTTPVSSAGQRSGPNSRNPSPNLRISRSGTSGNQQPSRSRSPSPAIKPNRSSSHDQSGPSRPLKSSKSKSPERQDHPVSISATLHPKTMIHLYRGNNEQPEQHMGWGDESKYKEFSDPHKLRLTMTPLAPNQHEAQASGRKVRSFVQPNDDGASKGFVESWSYAAGRKSYRTQPGDLIIGTRAASSRIDAPVGANAYLNGAGTLRLEASNSPSTSPPGSPGRHPPQIRHLFGDSKKSGRPWE